MTNRPKTRADFARTRYSSLPTEAFGVVFRSILEARVATFLTHIGAQWEYEPQTFVRDNAPYTPDFLIKNVWVRNGGEKFNVDRAKENVWLEVKPNTEFGELHRNVLLPSLSAITKQSCYLMSDSDVRCMDWFQLSNCKHTSDSMEEFVNGGWVDNIMSFQSDGKDVNIEFQEGNYAWGIAEVTQVAVNRVNSTQF